MGIVPASLNTVDLILQASLLVKMVLLILMVFSVVSWAIIYKKYKELRQAEGEDEDFLEVFHEGTFADAQNLARDLVVSPLAGIFLAVVEDAQRLSRQTQRSGPIRLNPHQVKILLRHISWIVADENRRVSSGLSFLATTGSAAPFIGLFGTVVGIINSFQSIGAAGSASLAVVAPGIAEALIATAVGLFAAIPATVAYNYFVGELRHILGDVDQFSIELQEDMIELVSGGNAPDQDTTEQGG